jgi:hypothetical protein
MPEQQAGFPHWEARFDDKGAAVDPAALGALVDEAAAGLTDLFIFSHGWNNDLATARDLYQRFFAQLQQVLASRPASAAKIGTVGLFWPSMRWADEAPAPARTGGAASLGSGAAAAAPPSDEQLVLDLKNVFSGERKQAAIEEMAALLRDRPADEQKLRRFQQLIGNLTEDGVSEPSTPALAPSTSSTAAPVLGAASAASAPATPPAPVPAPAPASGTGAVGAVEDNGEAAGLLGQDAVAVFQRFAALAPQRRVGGAADLGSVVGKLWNGAKEALRVATYWQMKARAGVVGQNGLGPLIDRLQAASPALQVHLIGHSFGARLVSFALAGVKPGPPLPVQSVVLLQGAFSHFAFAPRLPQDPNRAGALARMSARVNGPLCVTHSLRDTAVGTAYPLASIAAHEDAAALADQLFRWGAMGHDGAQGVDAAKAALGPVGTRYMFGIGSFLNLDANQVIVHGGPPAGAHSDIVHPEIAWAVLAAARVAS